MKKLLFILAILIANTAWAVFPPCTTPGDLHWEDGIRHECSAGGAWIKVDSEWRTSDVSSGFNVDSEGLEFLYLADGTFSITMDSAATLGDGFSFAVKNVGTGTITIDPSGLETIDGATTYDIADEDVALTFVSDGTNWQINEAYGAAPASVTYWDRTGTTLSPSTSGDDLNIDAGITLSGAPGSLANGLIFGDGDTALVEQADDNLQFYIAGTPRWVIDSATLGSSVSGAAQILQVAPTGTSPAYRFRADADTGIGSAGADQLSIIAGGVEVAQALENTFDQFIVSPDGVQDNSVNPSLAFGDGNTGFYESVDNTLEVSVAGTARWEYAINAFRGQSTSTPNLQNAAGTTTTPNITWVGDLNTGFSRSALDTISVIAGGDEIGFFTDTVDRQYFQAQEAETTRVLFEDEMWGTLEGEWFTRVSTGSRTPQSISNGVMRFTTGATTNDEESVDWNDVCTFVNTLQPEYRFTLALEQTTNIETEFGLMEASGGGSNDYIRIYYDASAGGTWVFEVCTAGVCSTDTGAIPDTSVHEYSIIFDSDTEVTWKIDGAVQGQLTTNVPTAQLQPYMGVTTEENAAHYVDFYRTIIWQDRT